MRPKILNACKVGLCVPGAVYVGRSTPYGNPFVIGKDGNRVEVIRKFAFWITASEQKGLRARAAKEMRGQNLICWCVPKKCHAEVWLKVIEGEK